MKDKDRALETDAMIARIQKLRGFRHWFKAQHGLGSVEVSIIRTPSGQETLPLLAKDSLTAWLSPYKVKSLSQTRKPLKQYAES